MALTITKERVVQLGGGQKQVTYKVVDSNGDGGTLSANFFNHIDNAFLTNITTATWVSLTWTDDSEDITIGSEGSGDTYKVTVIGV